MQRSRRRLFITTISIVLAVFIIVPLTVFLLAQAPKKSAPAPTHTIIIDNLSSYNSGIDSSVFSSIAATAYGTTLANIPSAHASTYHGDIRKGSFKKTSTLVSFLLDIPSLEVSWAVSQGLATTSSNALSDASVSCVTKSQAVYPLIANCVDQSNGGQPPAAQDFLQLASILPLTAPSYQITYDSSSSSPSGYELVITYYIPDGKQAALDALTKLGYDPNNYTILYVDSTS